MSWVLEFDRERDDEAALREYERALEYVRTSLFLDETGQPWPSVRFAPNKAADGRLMDDGNLRFGDRVGPTRNVNGIFHELGHMMIAADDQVGQTAWGLVNPNVIATRYGIDPVKPISGGYPMIQSEAKAWAWEHLIEDALGLSRPGGISDHTEVRLLDDTLPPKSKAKLAMQAIRSNMAAIRLKHPDVLDAVRSRLSNIAAILDQNKRAEPHIDEQPVSTRRVERDDGETKVSLLLESYRAGMHSIRFEITEGGEFLDSHHLVDTTSLSRATRMFDIACAANEMVPVPDDEVTPFAFA